MAVDVPDMVEKFMESHEDMDAVREMRFFEFFYEEVFMRCLG
jgi:hypothetical protein